MSSREDIRQKEIKLGPHRGTFKGPPQGDKKFFSPKNGDYQGKIETKKTFSREDIRQKEIKLGPHRGTFKGPPQGDKYTYICLYVAIQF